MKQIKKIRYTAAAFMMILAAVILCGCHGSKGMREFTIPEEFDISKDYEITFWAKNDTNKTQTQIYENAISEFEKLYPNIKVNIRLYTDYGRIYNDVITNITTGTTPNVCITYPDHIATYLLGNNVVVPLDSLISNEKYGLGGSKLNFDSPQYSDMISKFMDECRLNGNYYALPFMRSTEACYVNKTYVEKLGYTLPKILTWDFVWEVSDAAAKKNSDGTYAINGQSVMIPFIYKSTDNMMIQMLRQKNAGYSNEDGDILIFNDITKGLLENIAEHVRTGAFSTFKISSYPANFLNAGQCIFAIDSTAGATWMGTNAPLLDISEDKIVDFETEVMLIPQFDIENPQMISQGPSICIFNKSDPQEVLASWLFAQYLITNDVQISYAKTEGYIPVTSKAQNSEEYADYISRMGEDNEVYYDVKIKASKLLLDNIDNTFVTAVFPGSASLRDAAGQLIENTVKSVRRSETVDDAYFEKLYDDMNALYRLDSLSEGSIVNAEEKNSEPLPLTSKIILAVLAGAWIFIILYYIVSVIKRQKIKK